MKPRSTAAFCFCLLGLLFLNFHAAPAQTVVLDPLAEGKIDSPEVSRSQLGSFLYVGWPFGQSSRRLPMRTLRSVKLQVGAKYLYNVIDRFYTLGLSLSYLNQTYGIESDDEEKVVFDTLAYEKELFRNAGFQLSLHHRFRLSGEGVAFAAFTELGGFLAWYPVRKYIREEALANDQLERTEIQHQQNIESFQFGATATFGYNRVGLGYTYFVTDYFNDATVFGELPRHMLGIHLGL
jgi:hypothetical protein